MSLKPFMLVLALLFDAANILFAMLDFIGIGLILSPIWNGIAAIIFGAWFWLGTENFHSRDYKKMRVGGDTRARRRLGRMIVTRILGPTLGNSIPIVKLFPFWLWAVWTAQEKGSSRQEAVSPPPRQQNARKPAYTQA